MRQAAHGGGRDLLSHLPNGIARYKRSYVSHNSNKKDCLLYNAILMDDVPL